MPEWRSVERGGCPNLQRHFRLASPEIIEHDGNISRHLDGMPVAVIADAVAGTVHSREQVARACDLVADVEEDSARVEAGQTFENGLGHSRLRPVVETQEHSAVIAQSFSHTKRSQCG
jgi:hypothetical protein